MELTSIGKVEKDAHKKEGIDPFYESEAFVLFASLKSGKKTRLAFATRK